MVLAVSFSYTSPKGLKKIMVNTAAIKRSIVSNLIGDVVAIYPVELICPSTAIMIL